MSAELQPSAADAADAAEADKHRATRNRSALWTTLTAFGGRGVGMALSLVSVPMTLGFLDRDRYGLWITIGSMLSWLSIADLGLGYGITNLIVVSRATDDREAARQAVSTSMFFITGISLLMTAVFALAFPFVPWGKVFAAPAGVDNTELLVTVALCAAIFFVNFPLGLIDKIYAGYQEGFITNYWSIATNVASVIALIVVARSARGLPWLVLALAGVPLILRLMNVTYLFTVHRPWLRPQRSAFRRTLARQLLKTGSGFLIAQMAAVAMWQNDTIIVAQLFGAGAVTPYSLSFRLGTTYIGIMGMWLNPLWPAYADAIARKDIAWVRQRLSRTNLLATTSTILAAIVFTLIGAPLIRIWTRSSDVSPSHEMLAAVGLYMVITVWCIIRVNLLNALGRVRGQMYYGVSAAILNIGLSIVLGKWRGPPGVCWATCIAGLIPVVGATIEVRWALRDLVAAPTEAAAQ